MDLKREFSDLDDLRLVYRGNKIFSDLFSKSVHSIRQLTADEASAKGVYRFLQNDRVSEEDIIQNLSWNCQACCKGRYVIAIQDTTEINLGSHKGRIRKDDSVGTTNANGDFGLGFMLHPSLIVDAINATPYGYAAIKVWNRPLEFRDKHQRNYKALPIEEKESYKWIETSRNTQQALKDIVPGMVIVQDREGDIYEQFALIPNEQTDLLIRARADRVLKDKTKLFSCLSDQPAEGSYSIAVEAKNGRQKRHAQIEIRYKQVEICKTFRNSAATAPSVKLWLIQAQETGYNGADKICWHLLTTINIETVTMAQNCIEWYSWRWMVEEVFRILKKEGYNIEASELEYGSSVRKLSLMIMETVIKLFLMRLAYAEPELELNADSCFSKEEQRFLEHQIKSQEGKTEKQKNPYRSKDLKRYVWAIARLGGWKGYAKARPPGITTFWIGLKYFKAAMQGWELSRNVSTR